LDQCRYIISAYEKCEDTNGVIRRLKSKDDRYYNGQNKTDKRTNNGLQNTIQKTKDRAPLKSGGELNIDDKQPGRNNRV